MEFKGFGQAFFDFFGDLTQNNEREWFQTHKTNYEKAVVAPMLGFIEAMGEPLGSISPHIKADPRRSGGSLFRIYRDTRFSKDKTPYKTHAAAQFRHGLGKDVHAPGFYLHASLSECVIGAGIWRPDGPSVSKIRAAIDARGADWIKARDHKPMLAGFSFHGESLARPPKGYTKDHPLLEDLKRKDFVVMHPLTPAEFLDPNLVTVVAQQYAACAPLMKFLCEALGLPF